jgi:hypothetical protein
LTNKACKRGAMDPHIHDDLDTDMTMPNDVAHQALCPCAMETTGRRALLGAGIGLGVAVAARAAAAQSDPAHDRPKEGDLLVRVDSAAPIPLTPDNLPLRAGQVLAWPMDPAGNVVRDGSRLNKVLVLRLDPSVLDAKTAECAANPTSSFLP